MAIKIAIANQKGGVGKTTTALSLADQLQCRGKKVLLIDCDPQRNSSAVYRAEIDGVATLYDVIMSGFDAGDCIQHTSCGDIIACDPGLQDVDTKIKESPKKYTILKRSIKGIDKKYDYIIFDTPPHVGVLLDNVLMAAQYLISPIKCDLYSVQGIQDFYETVKDDFEMNDELKLLGLIKNQYKGRQSLTKDLEENTLPVVAEKLNTKIFKSTVRDSVRVAESAALGIRLSQYKPGREVSEDFSRLTDEILSEIGE